MLGLHLRQLAQLDIHSPVPLSFQHFHKSIVIFCFNQVNNLQFVPPVKIGEVRNCQDQSYSPTIPHNKIHWGLVAVWDRHQNPCLFMFNPFLNLHRLPSHMPSSSRCLLISRPLLPLVKKKFSYHFFIIKIHTPPSKTSFIR